MNPIQQNKLLAVFLSLCLVVGLWPAAVLAAEEDSMDSVVCETSGDSMEDEAESSSEELLRQEVPEASNGAENTLVPLAENEMSGFCGATETDTVAWRLEQNNEDSQNPTYTLILDGAGVMIDYLKDGTAAWCIALPTYQTAITKIVIGKDITVIGQCAFVGCSAVTEVTFEEGSQLREIRLNGFPLMTALREITLPGTLEALDVSAFYGCSSLEKVILQNPDNLISIGVSAFGRCSSLKYFNNPEEKQDCEIMPRFLKTIGANAFANCSQMIGQITIPAGVESLSGSFLACSQISKISFESGSHLKLIDKNTFHSMTGISEITLPEELETIGDSAFWGCTSLETVILKNPDKLTAIVGGAFGRCSSLKYFNNPEKKQDCEIMPSSVTKIGGKAFLDCSQLIGQITIPAAVQDLNTTFQGCTQITKISFENGSKIKTIGPNTFWSTGISEIILPEGIEIIGENAFRNTHLTAIEIPASVTKVSRDAFRCDTNPTLATVTFAEGSQLKEIETSAFGKALASITLPEGLTTIGSLTFGQTKLQYITIPYSVTSIGSSAFSLSCPIAINLSAVSDTADITNCCNGTITHGSMIYLSSETAKAAVGTPASGKPIWLITNGGIVPEQEFIKYQLATPQREGYRFDGWYKEEDFSGTPVTTLSSANHGETRYAKWIGQIDFDANGGNGSMESQEITTHADNTLHSMNGLSRDGYEFTGWNTEKDGTGDFYADADVIKPLENTTLYAQWAKRMDAAAGDYFVYALQEQTYTGAPIEPKVIVKNALTGEIVVEDEYNVEYQDNINTGTATVTVTKGGNSVELEFEIIKDENPVVSIEPVSVMYGTDYTITVTAKTSAGNVIENAEIVIRYYTDEQCTQGETSTPPVNAGEYWIKATLADTDHYAEKSAVAKITISNAAMPITVQGYSGIYDGRPHSIAVTADGAAVMYAEAEDGVYSADKPSYTNAGTYTVYYQVTKANYDVVRGSEQVIIDQANQSISYEADTIMKHTYSGAFTNPLTQTTVGGKITYTSSNTDVATVDESGKVNLVGSGETIITATAAETNNYKLAAAKYTLVITDAHQYIDEVKAPTCTEQGYTTHTCSVCKQSYTDAYVDAAGHLYGDSWQSDENGKWYECTICGYRKAADESDSADNSATNGPQTGEANDSLFWIFLLVISAVSMGMILLFSKKQSHGTKN